MKNAQFGEKLRSLILSSFCLGLAACSSFATTTEVSGLTYVHFDERFPKGMQDFMDSCHSPLVLKAGQSSLKMKGSCSSTSDLSTSEGKLLYGLLATRTEKFSPIQEVISSDSGVKKIDHFPMKGCEIHYSHALKFKQVTLRPQDSYWGTQDGEPAFVLSFAGNDSEKVATLEWRREIECPNGIKEALVEGAYGIFYPESQDFSVRFDGLRLTLFNRFRSAGTVPPEFKGKLIAEAEEDAILIGREGLLLTAYGSGLELLDGKIESMVEQALRNTAQEAAALMAQAVPEDHSVCTLRTQDADSMVMTTDHAEESTMKRCRREIVELE